MANEQASGGQRHMLQLVGLRAFAVLFVLYHHYGSHESVLRAFWGWGWFGVRLFFVLSGFLITGIILNCRQQVEAGHQTVGSVIYKFYVRRFLRIVPLYYLYLCLLMLVVPDVRQYWLWLVTYLQNLYFFFQNGFPGAGAGPLWTLAVEAQFYLVWPLLFLMVPRKSMKLLVVAFILLGPVSRALVVLYGYTSFQAMMLTSSNFDSLGLGGLLAICVAESGDGRCHSRWLRGAPWLGAAILTGQIIATHVFGLTRVSNQRMDFGCNISFILADCGAALLFVWLVYRASVGFEGPVGRLLSWRPLTYTGQISYGIYVFHMLAWIEFREAFPRLHQEVAGILTAVGVYILASLSWRYFESPINNLKRYFPYS